MQGIDVVDGEIIITLLYLTGESDETYFGDDDIRKEFIFNDGMLLPFTPQFTEFDVTEPLTELHGITQGEAEEGANQVVTVDFMNKQIKEAVEEAVTQTLEAVNQMIDEIMKD